jgi:hypothetical protein
MGERLSVESRLVELSEELTSDRTNSKELNGCLKELENGN